MTKSVNKLSSIAKVKSFDDMFAKTAPEVQPVIEEKIKKEASLQRENKDEKVVILSLDCLVPFSEHPFKLYPEEKMKEMVESIKQQGVISPILVRNRDADTFEIIAGHNRVNCAKLAGLTQISAIIKDIDYDAAVIKMVDSNLNQREKLLPSERAFAYKLKAEAYSHKGKNDDDEYLGKTSYEIIGQQVGISARSVARYKSLVRLIPEFLDMVDDKKITVISGSDISQLTEQEQKELLDVLTVEKIKLTDKLAEKLKTEKEKYNLDRDRILKIFAKPQKPSIKKGVKIAYKRLTPYFDKDTDEKTMQEEIIKALEFYRKAQDSQFQIHNEEVE